MTPDQIDTRLPALFPNLDWTFSYGGGECDYYGCANCDSIDLDICLQVKTFEHKHSVVVSFGRDIEFPNIESALEWLEWLQGVLGK